MSVNGDRWRAFRKDAQAAIKVLQKHYVFAPWQPIKTMPKDGTEVYLMSSSGRIDVGCFENYGVWDAPDGFDRSNFVLLENDIYGEINSEEGLGLTKDDPYGFTHWLPKTPTKELENNE